MLAPKICFLNKDVYVGIDQGKKSNVINARCDGESVKTCTMTALADKTAESIGRWFPGARIHVVCEAGFSGFVLHRQLEKAGLDSRVINPGSVEVAANDRVKTDKRDAKKMARDLEDGRLEGIYVPTLEEELGRLYHRTRGQCVAKRSRVSNQIKSRLQQFGLMAPDDDAALTGRSVGELMRRNDLPEELSFVLNVLGEEWVFIDDQIRTLAKKLKEQAATDPNEAIYRSAPGIGPVTSRMLATELGDLSKRFANERQLFSMTGLTPSEYSTGSKSTRGAISRKGPPRVRALLVEAAWRAIQDDESLRRHFAQLALRTGKNKAIVAVARKLIGRIRACFAQGKTYEINIAT